MKGRVKIFTWIRTSPMCRGAGKFSLEFSELGRIGKLSTSWLEAPVWGIEGNLFLHKYRTILFFSKTTTKKQDLLQGGETIYLCFASIPAATPKLLHPQPWTGLGIHGLAVGRGMHLWWTIGTLYLHKYRTLLYFSKTIMNKLEDCSYVCRSYLIHSQHHWTL